MSDQDFRERVLSAIDDLKRTTERVEDRIKRVEDRVERVEGKIEQVNENVNNRLTDMGKEVSNVHGDVRWIRGKLEGRQEATSSQDAKTALWIALGSALAAIVSLIKSFWS